MFNYKTKSFELSELKTLTVKEAGDLKLSLLKQNSKCPLCGCEVQSPVLDHQHLTNKDTIGDNGSGLVRGVLCNTCNVLLGKIENNSKRYLKTDLCDFLRNAANYLESDNLPFIHPRETKRLKEICKKSDYNKFIRNAVKNGKDKEKMMKKYKYAKYYNKSLNELRNIYGSELPF